ncbi:hypothetical protein CC86DRAFT_413388 [Ophiobolus disseminans]|uniref:Uncharacterized protein n=1 Tax=Ophiobolus disseminans TaxID=1469910 RepID=A0A6A6ZD23_9PLEO|nr:hypothetical protein CC86DRAFT_413388 [Ophiobolus disseminans]
MLFERYPRLPEPMVDSLMLLLCHLGHQKQPKSVITELQRLYPAEPTSAAWRVFNDYQASKYFVVSMSSSFVYCLPKALLETASMLRAPEPSSRATPVSFTVTRPQQPMRPEPVYMSFAQKRPFFKNAPATAGDLQLYTEAFHPMSHGLPSVDGHINNGKANATRYGSISQLDLGLCFETFFSPESCLHDNRCRWRHSPLTKAETAWLSNLGAESVEVYMKHNRCTPSEPEPTPWYPPHMFAV